MKQNKISKYLLYAIGEIVLVVIGILIALQVNDWSENNKQQIEIKLIKASLLSNLSKDTTMLNSAIQRTQRDANFTSNLVKRMDQKHIHLDTLKAIAKDFYPNFRQITSFSDATFQSILSTGRINYLSKDLRVLLLENKKLQDHIIEGSNESLYEKKSSDYDAKYPFGQSPKNYLHDLMWTIEDERDFATKLYGLNKFREFFLNQNLRRAKDLLTKTKQIINEINNSD